MPFDCFLGAWRAHEPELRGYLIHRSGDSDTADDLLQDIFLKSMRHGQGFCELDNPRAWLFQVARNALVDRARRASKIVELSDQLAAPVADDRPAVDELDVCLQRNLSEMPPEESEIITKCDLQGVKQQAYADSQGLSLAATKSRILRARKRLRDALVKNCQVRFDEAGRICCHVPETCRESGSPIRK